MFGMPAATRFDLSFRLLGIPVRVSPWFWLVTVLLGPKQPGSVVPMVAWIGCVFASIMVHEFGHGLMARAFGYRAEIALYGMGGLCASEAEKQTPWQRLAVLFSGPGAGFVLFGFVLIYLVGAGMPHSDVGRDVIFYLVFINLGWGLMNLLPVWPLDGGQITGVVLGMANRRNGARWGHIVSLVTAGLLAVLVVNFRDRVTMVGLDPIFLALFFGSFAFINFQALQAYQQRFVEYGQEDADWWKR